MLMSFCGATSILTEEQLLGFIFLMSRIAGVLLLSEWCNQAVATFDLLFASHLGKYQYC